MQTLAKNRCLFAMSKSIRTGLSSKSKPGSWPMSRQDIWNRSVKAWSSCSFRRLALSRTAADAIHMTVIWGNCRVLAARLNPGITHLRAAIFDQPITESEFLLMQAMENFHRLDLTDYEKYRSCKKLMTSIRLGKGKIWPRI